MFMIEQKQLASYGINREMMNILSINRRYVHITKKETVYDNKFETALVSWEPDNLSIK